MNPSVNHAAILETREAFGEITAFFDKYLAH